MCVRAPACLCAALLAMAVVPSVDVCRLHRCQNPFFAASVLFQVLDLDDVNPLILIWYHLVEVKGAVRTDYSQYYEYCFWFCPSVQNFEI